GRGPVSLTPGPWGWGWDVQVSIPRCRAGHWASHVRSPGFNKESAYDQGSSRKCWRTFLVFLHLEEGTDREGHRVALFWVGAGSLSPRAACFPASVVSCRDGSCPPALALSQHGVPLGWAGRAHGSARGAGVVAPWKDLGCRERGGRWPRDLAAHARLPPLADEDVCVFKCSVSRETECSRVGKQSFIITLGCNSVLIQFATPSGVLCCAFYGYLSQQQNMMQDYVRTGTYQRAILQNHTDFKDKIVLDVGCGSGILSFFAAQAGARKIYAVDIIISEPMGYMLFNERMLESYLHAKKYLRPGGNMFPTIGDVHLAPFTDEQLYMEQFTKANFWYQPSFHGVDLSALRGAAVDEYFRQPVVDTFDIRILMAKSVKYTVNFLEAKEGDLHRIEIPFKFHMLHSGLVHGLAFWFDVAFIGSIMTVWLSTAPTEPLTHWYQVRCLFQSPLFAKAGDTLSGTCLLIANKRQSYDISIVAQVDQTGSKSSNLLDLKNPFFRYTGTTPSPPPGSHYTSPSENMWNTGSTYNLSSGMAVAGEQARGSSGGSSSAHYAVNSQFTMGGPAISMASPMSIPTNTMHYGS
ncbi:hypothetical protein E2I00_011944, partial [Balaenoptera physalus]